MIVRALILVAILGALPARGADWPEILPMDTSYEIVGGVPFAIEEPIKGPSGKTEYVLSCSNHPADDVFDAGLFLCRLNEEENAALPEWSLLREDDSPVWFSRGLFRIAELETARHIPNMARSGRFACATCG